MARLRGPDKNGLGGGAAPSAPTLGNIFTVGPSDVLLFFMSDNGQGLLLVSEEFPSASMFSRAGKARLYVKLYIIFKGQTAGDDSCGCCQCDVSHREQGGTREGMTTAGEKK